MKKIIRIIMISSFAFILTACSGKNSAVTETSFSEVNSENVSTSSGIDFRKLQLMIQKQLGDVFAMDTYMTVKAYGPQGDAAVEAAVEEINRLDALLSTGNEDSEVAGINVNNGGHLSEDGAVLMERSLELYKSTGGVFDVAIYPVMKRGFTDGNYRVPDDETLKSLLQLADPSLIEYDSSTADVNFEEKGVQIDFGGIAKGYTSSRIMDIYKEKGVTSGLVNLGGNAQVLGTKPDGQPVACGRSESGCGR